MARFLIWFELPLGPGESVVYRVHEPGEWEELSLSLRRRHYPSAVLPASVPVGDDRFASLPGWSRVGAGQGCSMQRWSQKA